MMLQVTDTKAVVLTAPLSLEGEESKSEYTTPNIVHRILSLLTRLRPGSDLTKLQASCLFSTVKTYYLFS